MLKQAICGAFLSLMMCWSSAAVAGPIVLSVQSGSVIKEYSLPDLHDMPVVDFQTTTIWTEGVQNFVGVPLAELMKRSEISSGIIRAQAVNDYAVEIDIDEITAEAPIIAYQRNGAGMSLRDKGPLWIVYPYDSDPNYRTEKVYTQSIWQLHRLSVQ